MLAGRQLPVELRAPVFGPVVPVALLQAHHAEAGLREPPGHDAAGRARADDEDICGFGGQDSLLPRLSAKRR